MIKLIPLCCFLVLITSKYQMDNIYEGKQGFQYIYYDDTKEKITVEFGFKYFGYHDELVEVKDVSGDSVIARSEKGKLYKRQRNLYYCNSEHKIDTKLRKKDYSPEIDKRRRNIFQIIAEGEISRLKDSLKVEYRLDKKFDSAVKSDYIFYRDTDTIPDGYEPNYKKKFYNSLMPD